MMRRSERLVQLISPEQVTRIDDRWLIARSGIGYTLLSPLKRVEVRSRGTDGWSLATGGAGERAELAAVGCAIDVDALYRDPLA